MSSAIVEFLLRSNKIIVPYEEILGARQVSSIIAFLEGRYSSFDFLDDDGLCTGPTTLRKSDLSSESIEAWLHGPEAHHETVVPKKIQILETSGLFNGRFEQVIEGINLLDSDGHILQLIHDGAAYPYGMLLKDILTKPTV